VSESEDGSSYIEEEDIGFINNVIQPYQDEPLAVLGDSDEDGDDEEDAADGIPYATLEARYEKREPVSVW
jgi:hypothetical protein